MPRVPLQPVTEAETNSRRGGGKAEEENGQVETDAMRKWRRDWRRIMAISVFYFDVGIEASSVDKIKGHLQLLGARFQAFFDNSVTHVISNRTPGKEHARGDILVKASQLRMKVWSVDKLVKFLTALLGHSPSRELDSAQCAKLSQLLRQEKLVGPSDRDPTARRDDYYYFKGPYILVWDPSHYNRPLLHKEWDRAATPYEGDWPQFRATPIGMCPFVVDPGVGHKKRSHRNTTDTSHKRRALELRAEKAAVTIVKSQQPPQPEPLMHKAADEKSQTPPDTETPTPQIAKDENEPPVGVPAQPETSIQRPPAAFRKYCEITASGMQRYSATSAVKSTVLGETGNGLGATHALASREVNNLQRKVLQPIPIPQLVAPTKAPATMPPSTSSSRVKISKKPGFCENCYERFENFDDHVLTKKHKKYAANAQNFAALDAIIDSLARQPKLPSP